MGSCGSIYDPAGNSLDCGDRGEIMGGNGMKRGVLTARTRQENIQDKSTVVIFTPPPQLTPGKEKCPQGLSVEQIYINIIFIVRRVL